MRVKKKWKRVGGKTKKEGMIKIVVGGSEKEVEREGVKKHCNKEGKRVNDCYRRIEKKSVNRLMQRL